MAEAPSYKPRLRLKSSGWFFYWTSYPHRLYGPVEIWVGPCATIEGAYNGAVVARRLFRG